MQKQIIECVPNFSEGNDILILNQIKEAIEKVEGVKFLDMDPGKATNRTVMTFVGEPNAVIEGAFQGIKKAAELIDMSKHKGEHPRMGATDVCPLIPISGITMDETAAYAKILGKRVGEELGIPVYLYESAAQKNDRVNLATIRAGEYEGFTEKIKDPNWTPDFGAAVFNSKSGCTAIGARDFLLAYNVNLNTTSTRRANSVAFDLRENGRVKEVDGKKVLNDKGEEVREPGLLKSVKAIGWYIEEYGIAQISMNLTNINMTPLHIAFDTAVERAHARGMRVTGSELVGLVPLKSMLDAGKYFLEKQRRSKGISEEEIIKIAVKSMGLDELAPFDPNKKIIEYVMRDSNEKKLVNMSLAGFANETARETPAPGGGSVSAAIAALGVSLGIMVASLSSHKKGWDDKITIFSDWAERGQKLKDELLYLVDEDTNSFKRIMDAFALPKNTADEKSIRSKTIQDATLYATEVPLLTMKKSAEGMPLIREMVTIGNPNSITDGAVGALCIRSAVYGAFLNVKINSADLKDREKAESLMTEAKTILDRIIIEEKDIIDLLLTKMK